MKQFKYLFLSILIFSSCLKVDNPTPPQFSVQCYPETLMDLSRSFHNPEWDEDTARHFFEYEDGRLISLETSYWSNFAVIAFRPHHLADYKTTFLYDNNYLISSVTEFTHLPDFSPVIFERSDHYILDSENRIVQIKSDPLDSVAFEFGVKELELVFSYDVQNRLASIEDLTEGVKRNFTYDDSDNLILEEKGGALIEYSNFDSKENPFMTLNTLLGFPFFDFGYQLSNNNPAMIKITGTDGSEENIVRSIDYDSKGNVVKIEGLFYFDSYECF